MSCSHGRSSDIVGSFTVSDRQCELAGETDKPGSAMLTYRKIITIDGGRAQYWGDRKEGFRLIRQTEEARIDGNDPESDYELLHGPD